MLYLKDIKIGCRLSVIGCQYIKYRQEITVNRRQIKGNPEDEAISIGINQGIWLMKLEIVS